MEVHQLIKNESLHTLIELPWSKSYLALMRPTEREDMLAKKYVFSKHDNEFIYEHWDKINRLTLIDPFRMGKLMDLVIENVNVPGDIVECGSYKGGSGIFMGLMLKKLGSNKHIHLFDSFEGLPDPDETHDRGYKKGQFKSNFDKLTALIESYELSDNITLHKGWFNATVPKYIENLNGDISLFHIDCDLYSSTMDCFPQLYPKMSEDGIVVLDDFNDGGRGEKKAVLEILDKAGDEKNIIVSTAPQSYFYLRNDDKKDSILDGKIGYDIKELLDNKDYLKWLEETINLDYEKELKAIHNNG